MNSFLTWGLLLSGTGLALFILARKIAALRKENEDLRSRMQQVHEMKKEFISHVSHELKAPLASMQETTHVILERIPGPLTEKQQRLLDLNVQCGKRLAEMIGNLLDLSRLEAGIVEYEMASHDITELVSSVVVERASHVQNSALRVRTDIQPKPLFIDCDPRRMLQLFTNLMENAFRFSSANGLVTVQVKPAETLPAEMPQAWRDRLPASANGYALVVISDSGPGIEDEHKEKVFETFHQVKRGRKTRGQSLGLGLAISRSLVEAHHGAIWVDDNPAGGSVFTVLLPRAIDEESLKQAS